MHPPTISNDQAVSQAGDTIHTYVGQAIKAIDRHFGHGYAQANPELVGACVQAQAADFGSACLFAAVADLESGLTAAIRDANQTEYPC